MTLTISNPTPGQEYVYTLTGNVYDNIVLEAGVDLNLNGYSVIGSGSGIGISSQSGDAEVGGGTVTGFESGVQLTGGYSAAYDLVVTNCLSMGIGMGGGNNSVYGCTVGNIGGSQAYGAVTGITFWGNNSYSYNNNVYGVHGLFESVAYNFGGTGSMVNCIAQGTTPQGWNMGVWNGGSQPLLIDGCYIWGFDFGVLGTGTPTLQNSTIDADYLVSFVPYVDYGGNSLSQDGSDGSGYIYGTSGHDTLVGSSGADTLVGLGGADNMYGGAGADTFVFSPGSNMSVAPDFTQGEDHIYMAYSYAHQLQYGTSATGSAPTLLWDSAQKVLYDDPDGAGGAAAQQVAWLPYVTTLTVSDFIGL